MPQVNSLIKAHGVNDDSVLVLNLDPVRRCEITMKNAFSSKASGAFYRVRSGSLSIGQLGALIIHSDRIVIHVEKIKRHEPLSRRDAAVFRHIDAGYAIRCRAFLMNSRMKDFPPYHLLDQRPAENVTEAHCQSSYALWQLRVPTCSRAILPSGATVMIDHPVLHRMVRKLAGRASLDVADREALLSLPFRTKVFEPSSYLVREGTPAEECNIILDGFAYRQKLTPDGSRQILSVHVPGDFVDLEGSLLNVADHNLQALTRCEVAAIPRRELRALIENHPRIAHALWVDTLIDGSIFREWILNVGRRDAKERIAHILCEFAKRLELAGLGDENGYTMPMTQEQLADCTGLTPVHVNRTLKALEAAGLIARNGRSVSIPDWQRLREAAGFSELYLHLDQAA